MRIDLNLNGGLGARFVPGPREVNNRIQQFLDVYTGVLYVASTDQSPTPVIKPDGAPVCAKAWDLQFVFDAKNFRRILQDIELEKVEWIENNQKTYQFVTSLEELKNWEDTHYLAMDRDSTKLYGRIKYGDVDINIDMPYNASFVLNLRLPIGINIYDARFHFHKMGLRLRRGGVIL